MHHHCKPSSNSVTPTSPRGRGVAGPVPINARNASSRTSGCVSITQVATGTAKTSIQLKADRADAVASLALDCCNEFMPPLLSAGIVQRQIVCLQIGRAHV